MEAGGKVEAWVHQRGPTPLGVGETRTNQEDGAKTCTVQLDGGEQPKFSTEWAGSPNIDHDS